MKQNIPDDWRAVDASLLLRSCDINREASVYCNAHTYDLEPNKPEENWLYYAFHAFQILKHQHESDEKRMETVASIGTAQGLDGVALDEIFHPKKLLLCDVHPGVIPVAKENGKRLISSSTEVHVLQGDLCNPLIERDTKADIIYANLPNIPEPAENVLLDQHSSTYFDASQAMEIPEEYSRCLLALQFQCLRSMHRCLQPGGSAMLNLGARMDRSLVEQMFSDCGFDPVELCAGFKSQSQPLEVLPGYSAAEREGTTFDFYLFEESQKLCYGVSEQPSTVINEMLSSYRVSATEALTQFRRGRKIGHIVHVMRGIPRTVNPPMPVL